LLKKLIYAILFYFIRMVNFLRFQIMTIIISYFTFTLQLQFKKRENYQWRQTKLIIKYKLIRIIIMLFHLKYVSFYIFF